LWWECWWDRSQTAIGAIWRWDYLDNLSISEYEDWMKHPLPMGWSIVRPPDVKAPTSPADQAMPEKGEMR
jgi:hypothetical protein